MHRPYVCCLATMSVVQLGGAGTGDAIEWCFVGDPGNRDTTLEETAYFGVPGRHMGSVDYEYRISKTEVSVTQHLEFVQAYWPHYAKRTGNTLGGADFVGFDIIALNGSAFIRPGIDPQRPTLMSWEYFARYCNWLHHGKLSDVWAFETGAYDTATFFEDDDGVWQHQLKRDPASRYWIPSLDEWIKAAHWDQSLNSNQGGYWQYATGSDTEPRPGFPGQGGERNAGSDPAFPIAVASYPHVVSPYGLVDLAGGQTEYTETPVGEDRRHRRWAKGSRFSSDDYGDDMSRDILGVVFAQTVVFNEGARPASSVRMGADMDNNEVINFFDVSMFIQSFLSGDLAVDFKKDGLLDRDDARVFLGLYLNNL